MALTTVQGQMLTAPLTLTGNLTFSDGSVQTAAASPYVLKNRIINGAMQIWQRGTSFSGTVYTADRWLNNYGTSPTATQSTDVPSTAFQYSLSWSGSGFTTMSQRIESYNCRDLVNQTITVSYWAKQTSGTGFGFALYSATAVDNFATLNILYTPTVTNPTSTWAFYSVTIPAASMVSSVANGISISFNTGSGSCTALITGVQLEIGTSATPFERRLYNQELANCQRYCYAINPNIPVIGPAAAVLIPIYIPATLRTTPTLNAPYTNATYTNSGSPTGTQWNAQQLGIVAASVTGTIAVNPISIINTNITGFYLTGATFNVVPNWISCGASVPNIIASAEL